MIKLEIDKRECDIVAKGDREDVVTETVLAIDQLFEVVAKASGLKFEAAALLIYQQVQLAHNKIKEQKEPKNGK